VGAQKRKVSKSVYSAKSKSTYFKRKAKSSSVSKTIKKELKAQKKVRAKTVRAPAPKPRTTGYASKPFRAMSHSPKVASAISKYFLSSDVMKQRTFKVAHEHKKAFEKQVEVTSISSAFHIGLKGRQKREHLNRLEVMRRNIMIMIRRLLSWFSARSYSMNMTIAGRRALSQLEDLYDLLILEAMDDESLLKLKVAYGEACYYVSQASRGYHKKHSGRGSENYSPYFDRFVDSATG